MDSKFFSCIILAGCLLAPALAQDVIVNAGDLGDIKGMKTRIIGGTEREYNRFLGIPYAAVPRREQRFLPAEDVSKPLSAPGSSFDAAFEGNSCVQPDGFSLFNEETRNLSLKYAAGNTNAYRYWEKNLKSKSTRAYLGNEDCLNLNIYTPKLPSDGGELMPVLVFIHGGAFSSGNGVFYNPSKLLEHDVVLVTFNYRLGVLGFFSLETDDAPGNAALYDMVQALRWIQDYIHHFGGDPNSVTLSGQSAGAAGVSHLMLSELSMQPKQLFHRGIALSGSALNDWATTMDPKPAGFRIAELAGCYDPEVNKLKDGNPDVDTILTCMKNVNPDNLVQALNNYQNEERKEGRLGFDAVSPVVQRGTFEPKLLRKAPEEILLAGEQMNIPLMQGNTKDDGTFPLGVTYNRFLNCVGCGERQNNATFLRNELTPSVLRSMGIIDKSHAVYHSLQNQFLQGTEANGRFEDMVPGLSDLNSVYFFKAGGYRNLLLHSRLNSDSYWYSFDYKGQHSLYMLFFPFPPPPIPGGVAHSDDLIYLFHFFTLNAADTNISLQFLNYVINFIHHGNPNIPVRSTLANNNATALFWPPFQEPYKNHIIMDTTFRIGANYMNTWAPSSCLNN